MQTLRRQSPAHGKRLGNQQVRRGEERETERETERESLGDALHSVTHTHIYIFHTHTHIYLYIYIYSAHTGDGTVPEEVARARDLSRRIEERAGAHSVGGAQADSEEELDDESDNGDGQGGDAVGEPEEEGDDEPVATPARSSPADSQDGVTRGTKRAAAAGQPATQQRVAKAVKNALGSYSSEQIGRQRETLGGSLKKLDGILQRSAGEDTHVDPSLMLMMQMHMDSQREAARALQAQLEMQREAQREAAADRQQNMMMMMMFRPDLAGAMQHLQGSPQRSTPSKVAGRKEPTSASSAAEAPSGAAAGATDAGAQVIDNTSPPPS